jgi:hypothetical protein
MAKASMSIDGFKGALRDGGARPNLFEVSGAFGGTFSPAGDTTSFLIKAAQLPASTLGQIPVQYRGRTLKLAGDREFEPWTITVINTNDFALRHAFESWSNLINQHASNESALDLTYMQQWDVTQLKRDGSPATKYKLVDCYPSNISPIELSHDSGNAIEEFTVTLEYQYWTNVDSTDS